MWEVSLAILDIVSASMPLNTLGKVPQKSASSPSKSPFYEENMWGKFPLQQTVKVSRGFLSNAFVMLKVTF